MKVRYSMSRFQFLAIACFSWLWIAPSGLANEDPKDEAIRKDREQIAGTWTVVELVVQGNKAKEEDARRLTVENAKDGTWKLFVAGKEICRGTSTIDPVKKPKTLDFTITEGENPGDKFVAIYELGDIKRKMCFAPSSQKRPAAFESPTGSEQILVHFERTKKPD